MVCLSCVVSVMYMQCVCVCVCSMSHVCEVCMCVMCVRTASLMTEGAASALSSLEKWPWRL